MQLDVNESNERKEEVAKAFNVSLSHIDTYRLDGEINILLGHTI